MSETAKEILFRSSETIDVKTNPPVIGYDFNKGTDYDALFKSFNSMGFQASNLGNAIDRVNEMLTWKLSDESEEEQKNVLENMDDETEAKDVKCTIFLGYTSNMISCGNREIIRYLVQHKLVDAIVTTGGGIEEDIMKCFNPHYMGDFNLDGATLRKKGLNRIGNLLVPNNHYCNFEDFITPVLDQMLKEQKEKGTKWTPSKIIARLGEVVDNPESVYYWANKNNIPVFCPAITDGSLGDMMFFHSLKTPGLVCDIIEDCAKINLIAMKAPRSGMLILGGGIVKHHICNANLMRNGADYCVFINTAQAFDGSDAGATPDEAVSWGKVKSGVKPVKVCCEASIAFPLLVSQTFAKHVQNKVSDKSSI